MSVARHHAEWLSLLDISGPFLSIPVLLRVFPDGLDRRADQTELRERLHIAFEEWREARDDPAIHRAFIDFILREVCEFDQDLLKEGQEIPAHLAASIPEQGVRLRPDLVLLDPGTRAPRLLVTLFPHRRKLESPVASGQASPATRMMQLLYQTEARLGLVTNGDHWLCVHAAPGETASFVGFYASLFVEEPLTLRAFASLLSARRLFGVPEEETLEKLFEQSAANQQEVTDQLGYQVRRAVELLIQTIDRIDRDRGRKLLSDLPEERLYEAAVTVMMRIVFLLATEDRGLLPLENPLYERAYAVATLREQLQETADRNGEQILRHRYSAWPRLLATFRAVHAGVRHDRLQLPAYGGSLFDPDRFCFLEGRAEGTTWRGTPAEPLPIDDLTILDILRSIQMLEVRIPGGRMAEARRLSFRSLDIEQIGHVYEGLLDHTARRAEAAVVSLRGSKRKEPEIPIPELGRLRAQGPEAIVKRLHQETGRSKKAIANALAESLPKEKERAWLIACDNDPDLYRDVLPWAGLVREDTHGAPVVFGQGSVYVTSGEERRKTGTHYTPRSLTEPIVRHTLEPLVYEALAAGSAGGGPAEVPASGIDRSQWRLKSPASILSLKVCDLAMGSGAFLVAACRYLAARLVEAWAEAEAKAGGQLVITPDGDISQGDPLERPLPEDPEERLVIARRIIADRCLHGVDLNPMAVEMAKLSLWLVTLKRDKPFTFLDHALRSGDALLGLTSEEQLRRFHLDPEHGKAIYSPLFDYTEVCGKALDRAATLRRQIESFQVETIRDSAQKRDLLDEARGALRRPRRIADLVAGAALQAGKRRKLDAIMQRLAPDIDNARVDLEGRRPFHWVLEFPEIVAEGGGFDAIVGNPPFQGSQRITGALGTRYRDYLVDWIAGGKRGSADLCAYFFLRAASLLKPGGMMGLLATNTIAQGDTREVGLDQLTENGFTIVRAVKSRPWPGGANLEVSHVWLRRGDYRGSRILDGKPVQAIGPYLARPGTTRGKPYRLAANKDKSFQGSIVLGMGFVLTPQEAQALIAKDPRNQEVLYPYLNGKDLNSRPDQSPSRFVINFHDWPLERAEQYPDCLAIVREKAKPHRDRLALGNATARDRAKHWWRFACPTMRLYATIAGLERVLVLSLVNNHLALGVVPATLTYAHRLVVFPSPDPETFTLLQAHWHYHWAWAHSSTMRRDINYSPSDCFETFPFPDHTATLDKIGERYHDHRRDIMLARQEGLTKTYNRFHDPREQAADIATLRKRQVEMDLAVLAAYGWSDLDPGHDFHQTRQGLRFTFTDAARRDLLDRLLALNHTRYQDELARGLHTKKPAKRTRRSHQPRLPL